MSDRTKIALLLAPALGVIVALFLGGVALGLLRSFNYMPVIGLLEPNLDAYVAVFTSREFYLSFALTFHIAFTSTLISLVLAIASALLLRRTFIGKSVVNFLFQLNLTVPHLVGAVGILYLFSQSGTFARLAAEWNLIQRPGEFPALVFDPYAIGIILQYVWKEIPFIGVIVLANMQALGEDYESVARSLGATRWQAFRHVLLPLIFPARCRRRSSSSRSPSAPTRSRRSWARTTRRRCPCSPTASTPTSISPPARKRWRWRSSSRSSAR